MIEQLVGRAVAPDVDERRLYRWGGLSALLLGLGYLLTIPLYVAVGAPPHGGEARLGYLVGKTTVWWAILGLSVFTDLLFLPVALALYRALRSVNKNAMVFATTLDSGGSARNALGSLQGASGSAHVSSMAVGARMPSL